MTTCTQYIEQISEQADDLLGRDEMAALSSHLAQCADCRLRAEVFSALHHTDLLTEPPPNFTERVLARIAEEDGPRTHPSLWTRRRPRTALRISMAAGAAALFALMFLGSRTGLVSMFLSRNSLSGAAPGAGEAELGYSDSIEEGPLVARCEDSPSEQNALSPSDGVSFFSAPGAEPTEPKAAGGGTFDTSLPSSEERAPQVPPFSSTAPSSSQPFLLQREAPGQKSAPPPSTSDAPLSLQAPDALSSLPVINPFDHAAAFAAAIPLPAVASLADVPIYMGEGAHFYLLPAESFEALDAAFGPFSVLTLSADTPADEAASAVLLVLFLDE